MSNLSRMVISVDKIREVQRAKGPATILAIATANPANCINQADYPDFYFRVTNSEHSNKDLKDRFKRICEKSTVKKRYFTLREEILKENPNITSYGAPSLNIRQDLLIEEVPKLGMEVATKAIKEWGKPISEITHLIFHTTSGLDMPGADFQLCKLLGLEYHSINRLMLYNNGCYAGGTLLRVAKDIAENNAGARILVVCVENMTIAFHSPCATHKDILVGQALFGDGAVALVIGADPNIEIEHPLFQLIHASQKTIPGSQNDIRGQLREMGLSYYLSPKVPMSISNNIEECLVEALKDSIGCDNIKGWNNLFYAIHPGGPTIINKIEEKLGLEKKKLRATRQVLSDYGNMWSPSVLYVLDEMRKISAEEGKSTNGEGLDWGFAVGFGPGLTIETVVLRALPTPLFVQL